MTSFLCTLSVNTCKAFDYGFGLEDKAPWQAQERNIFMTTAPLRFLHLLSYFHDHLDDDYEQDWGTQVMFSSKVDEKDLRRTGSFLSSSVYDSQEIQKNLQVEMKLGIELSFMN